VDIVANDAAAVTERIGPRLPLRPLAVGLSASVGLLALYLGIITIAQDWAHAVQQLAEDRWFVAAILAGFGTQAGLFMYLRGLHSQVTAAGVAASTGTSTTAMLACCAHHLTEILPIIGLSGAAIFLESYKEPLLWLGIVMNGFGILYLQRKIQQRQRMVRYILEARRMKGQPPR